MQLAGCYTLLMILLCGLAIGSGQFIRHPHHSMSQTLALCNGQPCASGIVVGLTAWNNLPGAFTENAPYYKYDRRHLLITQGDVQMAFYQSVDEVHVGRGRLSVLPGGYVPVGWIIVRYGEPCGLSYYPRTGQIVLRYPHSLVNVQMTSDEQFSPNTGLKDVRWQDPAFENEMQPDICVDNITDGVINSAWRGFHLSNYTD